MSTGQTCIDPRRPGTIEPGQRAVVCGFEGCPEAECALRKIGLREGVEIEWIGGCSPALIRCERTHIAICPKLLAGVRVLRLPGSAASPPDCRCARRRRPALFARVLSLFGPGAGRG